MDYICCIMYILYIHFDHICRENISEHEHEHGNDQLRGVKTYFCFMLSYFCVGFSKHVIKYFFLTEVQLIYNAVPTSAVQQSDSVIHIQTFFFLIFFSIRVYHRIIQFPVLYSRTLLFIHPIYNSLPLLIPDSQSFPPTPSSPLATTSLFSMSVSLFLFCRQVHLCHISDSTYKCYYMVFIFLFLTYFTQYDNLQLHPCCCK